MNPANSNNTDANKCAVGTGQVEASNATATPQEMNEMSIYQAVLHAEMLEFVPLSVDCNFNSEIKETARMLSANFVTSSLIMRLIKNGSEVNITDDKTKSAPLCDSLYHLNLAEAKKGANAQ